MPVHTKAYKELSETLGKKGVTLVAVSKTKPVEDIQALYDLGHRDFGENYVQELMEKQSRLPADIRWHFIGHLQSNKVRSIAPFVHLIHGVDSYKLLKTIEKEAIKYQRVMQCLLQVHIAKEETKFGLDAAELEEVMTGISDKGNPLTNVIVSGLMGMASFTESSEQIRTEFRYLRSLFDKFFTHGSRPPSAGDSFPILSMGMSSDYQLAVEEGSNMVRIGSLLFGARN